MEMLRGDRFYTIDQACGSEIASQRGKSLAKPLDKRLHAAARAARPSPISPETGRAIPKKYDFRTGLRRILEHDREQRSEGGRATQPKYT